jgi:hypothetical protein
VEIPFFYGKINYLLPRKLTEKSIIQKGPKIGRTWSYRLNDFYAWRGSIKNLKSVPKAKLQSIPGGKKS